ncbi:hypothetical protein KSP40_PGU009032 [Platanthera guangdongensis]|uniref:Uncharacterized protein n=1 Tax=Platanthera guangdongensis TaxID=2320717 RepID=A0ABR2M5C0_9ASPA
MDAQQVLQMIVEAKMDTGGGTVENDDCRLIITAAFDGRDVELALSVFYAMLSGRAQAFSGMNGVTNLWVWARPDVQTYALLVRRLASCLRVADAVRIIGLVSGSGVTFGDEDDTDNISSSFLLLEFICLSINLISLVEDSSKLDSKMVKIAKNPSPMEIPIG